MIIWLNGAYGVGKTTCASELSRRLVSSFVYDPENAGYFIRRNIPKELQKDNFQDHKQWRDFNYEMLKYISSEYTGTIIVPMAIINRQYYEEIIQRLTDDGILVKHYILTAEKSTIQKRLNSRFSRGTAWAKLQTDRCMDAFNQDITDEKIMTDHRDINSVVEEIAARSKLSLLPDNRYYIKKQIGTLMASTIHRR